MGFFLVGCSLALRHQPDALQLLAVAVLARVGLEAFLRPGESLRLRRRDVHLGIPGADEVAALAFAEPQGGGPHGAESVRIEVFERIP